MQRLPLCILCLFTTLSITPAIAADRDDEALDFWSLRPLTRPAVPKMTGDLAKRVRNPIDAFILARLQTHNLQPSPQADRRTLIRRLYFDLIGLPPTPPEVDTFINDKRPDAYARLVDRLLASPRYGERWARHWLDVVHYGDTHGYDKDKLRPNAWPYRDYVIRAFNEDKPYRRFVREQVAGDALWPNTRDGVVATGFIAAGPWDFIGHAEVPESKIDGKVARHTDRDDMVRTVMEAFTSTTVGCAQCHHHKFDPVSMEDYYSLQAVFAALDRADRPYEIDPQTAKERALFARDKQRFTEQLAAIDAEIKHLAGPELAKLDARIAAINKAQSGKGKERPEFGYHSGIERRPDVTKWVQVDLGKPTPIAHVVLVACNDNFNNIGPGFGFPVRFRVEASNDPAFKTGVTEIADKTASDYPNPKVVPQSFAVGGDVEARYVRVTATKLVNRLPNDYIFALAELLVMTPERVNTAAGKKVASLDSIEAPDRWRRSNLTDRYYYGVWNTLDVGELTKLTAQRDAITKRVLTPALKKKRDAASISLAAAEAALDKLPERGIVYAGVVHKGSGNFVGRAGKGPRPIHVLNRGQVTQPGATAHAGTIDIIPGVAPRFAVDPKAPEYERRIALANWLVRKDNPLTWRSIVNRVWLYHFGRSIVDSPNDFGQMGQRPTHPELLDWLAVEFRDGGQSIKDLHRLIVTSATYQQVSTGSPANERIDASNRFVWRMNRRKVEAEALRDTILYVASKLDTTMGGPGFRDFVLEKPQHSPHYKYEKHDPNDPKTHRRSVYRFIVRSQPQPFMDTLDCADPSQMVGKRNDTLTALQALALLNNKFVLRMSEHFAARLSAEHNTLPTQINAAFRIALSRPATTDERDALIGYAKTHGLANTCRLIFNLNEFAFVD